MSNASQFLSVSQCGQRLYENVLLQQNLTWIYHIFSQSDCFDEKEKYVITKTNKTEEKRWLQIYKYFEANIQNSSIHFFYLWTYSFVQMCIFNFSQMRCNFFPFHNVAKDFIKVFFACQFLQTKKFWEFFYKCFDANFYGIC